MNAVVATEASTVPLSKRAVASFIAFCLGWAAGELFFTVYWLADPDGSTWRALVALGILILVFGGAVWLFVMLPLSLMTVASNPLCSAWVAPNFGGVVGFVAFVIETGFVDPVSMHGTGFFCFGACAAVVGATAWASFAWWLRRAAIAAHRSDHPLGIAPRM
jgi:hypothetical protein